MERVGEIWVVWARGQEGEVALCLLDTNYTYIFIYTYFIHMYIYIYIRLHFSIVWYQYCLYWLYCILSPPFSFRLWLLSHFLTFLLGFGLLPGSKLPIWYQGAEFGANSKNKKSIYAVCRLVPPSNSMSGSFLSLCIEMELMALSLSNQSIGWLEICLYINHIIYTYKP